MNLFQPERYFSSIACINIERDLLAMGYRCVLLDIDNTIRSRETNEIPQAVKLWLQKAAASPLSLCLLSNNWHRNVYEFADSLRLPIVAKACKPVPFAYYAAMHTVGGTREDTVMIGDQILTDVVGAHLAGFAAWLVCPLSEVDIRNIIPMRSWEQILLGSRKPEGAHAAQELCEQKGWGK